MLVLSRKPGEKVVIGANLSVTVVEIRGNSVQLAFEAPDQVPIIRGEFASWLDEPAVAESSECADDEEPLGGCWRLQRG